MAVQSLLRPQTGTLGRAANEQPTKFLLSLVSPRLLFAVAQAVAKLSPNYPPSRVLKPVWKSQWPKPELTTALLRLTQEVDMQHRTPLALFRVETRRRRRKVARKTVLR